jgi:general secretion pathway protein G
MQIFSQKQNRGFTLIELLVVIAIIGLLSSVVLASLNSARLKARDAERESDIHQIKVALSFYVNAHGHYPIHTGWLVSYSSANWNALGNDLASYLPKLPVDPLNNGTSAGPWVNGNYTYAYKSDSTGSDYDLVAQFENTGNDQRCQLRGWIYHTGGGGSWCAGFPGSHGYSLYLYADH